MPRATLESLETRCCTPCLRTPLDTAVMRSNDGGNSDDDLQKQGHPNFRPIVPTAEYRPKHPKIIYLTFHEKHI